MKIDLTREETSVLIETLESKINEIRVENTGKGCLYENDLYLILELNALSSIYLKIKNKLEK